MTTVDEHQPISDEESTDENEPNLAARDTRAAGRWMSAGMPTEKSKNFRASVVRLGSLLGPEWLILGVIFVTAILSAFLNVLGPRVLGHGTDVIFKGVITHQGIDFGKLHRVLMELWIVAFIVVGISTVAALLAAICTIWLVLTVRRVTLAQITENLAGISEQLARLQQGR